MVLTRSLCPFSSLGGALRALVLLLTVWVASFCASGAQAYTIAPGDTLQIEILEDPSLNRPVLVLPDGTISFPAAGSLKAAGASVQTVSSQLSARLAGEFASAPTVYVSVAQLAPKDTTPKDPALVYVMGEINKPGALSVADDITLLQAIAQAGGFTRFAATKRVELHRMDPQTQTEQIYIFDQKRNRGISGATPLNVGDVIVVPERRLFE